MNCKRELREYKYAVEVLKSYWLTGKIANQNIYEAVTGAKSRKPCSFFVALEKGIRFHKVMNYMRRSNNIQQYRRLLQYGENPFLL